MGWLMDLAVSMTAIAAKQYLVHEDMLGCLPTVRSGLPSEAHRLF